MQADIHPGDGLLTPDDWRRVADTFGLSQRETEVAQLLFQGLSRDAVAFRLRKPDGQSLSPETVRVYVNRLYEKLGVAEPVGMCLKILTGVERFQAVLPSRSS